MTVTKDTVPGTPYFIYQNTDFFKYGIDSVLLSWFAKTKRHAVCVDLCAGSGIVGLRQHAIYGTKQCTFVEMQKDVAELCQRTIDENHLIDTCKVLCENLQTAHRHFERGVLDCITVNPPYMKNAHGFYNKTESYTMARHEVTMQMADLFSFAQYTLRSGGMFYLVHRPQRIGEIFHYASQYKLNVKEIMPVCSRVGEDPKFVLIACKKDAKSDLHFHAPLVVYEKDEYTPEILRIYEGERR